MGGGGKEEMELQPGNGGILNGESSGMNSEKMNSGSTYFASGWDPNASLSDNFASSQMVSHNEFSSSLYPSVMGNKSLVQYPSASNYSELVPKIPCFGSGSYGETVGPFGINECGPITNAEFRQNYAPNMRDSNERIPTSVVQSQVVHHPQGAVGTSPDGKKRKHETSFNSPNKSKKQAEDSPRKDQYQESSEVAKEQNDSKSKTEQNNSPNTSSKNMGKQAADKSSSGDAPKENYIHVRARRGQATNSHSLAERIRREKISERMRLLQELVPGCNKITGKAVMLDEIINYVQSLQQQVEFLSMKLATVNPEMNIDIDRILSKDVYSRGPNSTIHGVGPGMSSSHPYLLGNLQLGLEGIPSMIPQFTQLPQAVLDNEFQNLLQTGFNSSSASDNLGPNARLKPGL